EARQLAGGRAVLEQVDRTAFERRQRAPSERRAGHEPASRLDDVDRNGLPVEVDAAAAESQSSRCGLEDFGGEVAQRNLILRVIAVCVGDVERQRPALKARRRTDADEPGFALAVADPDIGVWRRRASVG